ncbi:MAG: AAA family ATPase [Gomphosphaeria aponina SAG 52.96 = DSM 107014]|uniref:non-specific protein-tyrosine kinase n=1 Tax=Gomphosphaeria aponina SAG 52.96 = DSM 107014 TaxID=1521640 RepID=A0A941GRF2_9CHRO|nr:AAA family ATPase [Gomphosphaeria aponina SAG 52.96 = DSM 107014]
MSDQVQDLPSEELEELNPQRKKGFNYRTYLRTFQRKALLIAVITGVTTSVAWLFSLREPDTYFGSFQFLVEPVTSEAKLTDPSTLTRTEGVPDEQLFGQDYPTLMKILKSPGMIEKIAKDIQEKFPSVNFGVIKKNLASTLTIERVGKTRSDETKIIEVNYRGTEAEGVQFVLEVAAENFLAYSEQERKRKIKAGVEFIDEQLPELEQRVDKIRSEQQKIQEQYDLINPNTKGEELFAKLDEIRFQKTETERELKELTTLKSNIESQLNLNSEEALAASDLSENPARQSLLNLLQEIESKIALESARFTLNTPNIEALEKQRNNLIALLDEETKKILKQYSTSLSDKATVIKFQNPIRLGLIQQLIDTNNKIQMLEVRDRYLTKTKAALENRARLFPGIIATYNDLERDLVLTSKILEQLLTQRETLNVESAQNHVSWEIISPPQVIVNAGGKPLAFPPDPKKKMMAGAIAGMLLGMGIAIVLEKRQDLFFSPDDIKDTLFMPLLGEIPLNETHLTKIHDTYAEYASLNEAEELEFEQQYSDVNKRKDNTGEKEFLFEQAFDFIYTKLCFFNTNPPLRSLVVSSVEKKDGQSTIALNLAKRAAAQGKRVLLVDANLSQPQLHVWLNLDNYKGLINLLTSQLYFEEMIQEAPEIKNLFVLTAGVDFSEKSQQLWSVRMQQLMAEFEAKYDLVIYDPPHFLESTDLIFLTAHTDGLLMVVGVTKTSQSKVKMAVEKINTFGLPTLGVVANYVS